MSSVSPFSQAPATPPATAAGAVADRPWAGVRRWLVRHVDIVVVVCVTVLAALLRFWALDRYPPGMHYDEGYNALDALKILQGEHHIFFGGNFGREPLFNYAIALALTLFAPGPLVMRSLTALAGTLAVPITYGIGRTIQPRARTPALLAALVQVALPWDLHMSRYGIRVEFLPLLGGAAVLFLLVGWRSRRWPWFLVSGLFLGLSLYGYMAARLLALVFLPWCLLALWRAAGSERKRLLLGFALTAATALIVFAPLGVYFAQHPDAFTLRAGQVAIKGGAADIVREFAGNTWLWVKAMAVAGDANPRNNLPDAAALTPWLVVPWLVGLAYCLCRRRRPEWALAPLWFAVMLLPSILSEHAPNFQRAVGAVPPLCLAIGVGLWQTRQWVARLSGRHALGTGLVVALLLGSTAHGLYQYFVLWGRSNALYYAFDEGIYQIGEYMRDRTAAGGRVYLSPVRSDHTALHLLMRDVGEPITFDGRELFVLPPADSDDVEYIVLTQEDTQALDSAASWFRATEVARTFVDRAGQTYAVALKVDAASVRTATPNLVARATWDAGISLLGVDIRGDRTAEGPAQVVLYWQADAVMCEDYTSFVHLIGPANPSTGTPLWMGADEMPGAGTYPTSRWSPGETIVEPRDVVVPEGLADGDYYLEIGWYLLATGERLHLTVPYTEDSLLLGPYHLVDGRVISGPDAAAPVSSEGPR